MNSTLYNLAMVIAERGSDWESWVDQFRQDADDVCLIIQQPGETVSELATRVRKRVDAIQPYETLAQAVVVSGGRVDQEAVSARSVAISGKRGVERLGWDIEIDTALLRAHAGSSFQAQRKVCRDSDYADACHNRDTQHKTLPCV